MLLVFVLHLAFPQSSDWTYIFLLSSSDSKEHTALCFTAYFHAYASLAFVHDMIKFRINSGKAVMWQLRGSPANIFFLAPIHLMWRHICTSFSQPYLFSFTRLSFSSACPRSLHARTECRVDVYVHTVIIPSGWKQAGGWRSTGLRDCSCLVLFSLWFTHLILIFLTLARHWRPIGLPSHQAPDGQM